MQLFQTQKNNDQFGERLSNGISFLVATIIGLATIAAALHGVIA